MNARDCQRALQRLAEAEAHLQQVLAETRGLIELHSTELARRLANARQRRAPSSIRTRVIATWHSFEAAGEDPRHIAVKVAKRCRCSDNYARQIVREHRESL